MTKSMAVHYTPEPAADTRTPDPHQDTFSKVTLGFWIYLMTDCLVFTTLFATYAVLHNHTFGGPSTNDIYSLSTAFVETLVLLCSTVSCGFAVLSAVKGRTSWVIFWLAATFLLGTSFVGLELHEFYGLVAEGNDWTKSAFLSSFFTLVGTHGTHVSFGLLWVAVMIGQVLAMGVTIDTFRRLVVFSMFWHFLDLVWVFIFTFVYLMGVI